MAPTSNPNPFQRIGLSLSGGGYRAAAFHLGTLRVLHRLGLLPSVVMLSTVSGGTFVGAAYVMALKDGQSFEDFDQSFREFMATTNLLETGLDRLSQGPPRGWIGHWGVLTAFAAIYHERLTRRRTFSSLFEGREIHLKDISFNATEFQTGVVFRFRVSDEDKYVVGNGNVAVPMEHAREIRLADIIAASSCFPGGFEPIAFPEDFGWADTDAGRAALQALQAKFPTPVALMDGGVFDNQGADTLLLQARHEWEKPSAHEPTLFIFSDVHKKREPLYQFPTARRTPFVTRLTLGAVKLLWLLFLVLSFATSLVSGKFIAGSATSLDKLLACIPFVASIGSMAVLIWLRIRIQTELCKIPKLRETAWRFLKKLTVQQVIDMAELRISSLFAMSSSVLMKRVRSLVYSRAFEDESLRGRRVANLIYKLVEQGEKAPTFTSEVGNPNAQRLEQPWLAPSRRMVEIASRAAEMPTTLWFENNRQMDDLIASGEMTFCFSLLDYILRNYGVDPAQHPPDVRRVFEAAKETYARFKAQD